jgi:hypothetical protein
MGDDYVQAPADGAGKKLQTFSNVVGANTVHSEAMTPVSSTGTELALATEATLATVHGHVDSIDAKMVSGTDIGDVTVNNGAGGAAVNVQDGGNTLTVDGAVTIGAALPAGTNAIGVVSTKTALTAAAPTAVSVGVASGVAVAANANRKGLVLTNTSNAIISLNCVGAAAVLLSGITLNANGGVWVMGEYTFTTAEIRAIASAAASNLAVQEFT